MKIQVNTGETISDSSKLSAIGKEISVVEVSGEKAIIRFSDGSALKLTDEGQSCCEHRYINTDDDVAFANSARLLSIEVAGAEGAEDEWGSCHEINFVHVQTSGGRFTLQTHNEHNGYYGGFYLHLTYFEGGAA